MKLKEFFKGKSFIFCFIVYILLTAIIFATSLMQSSISVKQSNFVVNVFSGAVEFITGGTVNLKSDGKTNEYPTELQLNNVPDRELMVGETFKVDYSFLGDGNYSFLAPTYYSTNENVLLVSKTTGDVKVVGIGQATIGVKETKSDTKSEVLVTVGSGVYTPKLDLLVGETESDGAYYFSTSNGVGALYYLYIDKEIDFDGLNVTCSDEDAFDFMLSKSMVAFLTKKVGNFEICVSGKYKNVNSLESGLEQTVGKSYSVNVVNHAMTKPTSDFSFKNETLNLYKNNETQIEYFNDRFTGQGELLESQTALFQSYSKNEIEVRAENESLYITPKNVGEFEYKIFYSDGLEIKSAVLKINSTLKRPEQIEVKSSLKNIVLDARLHLTILGDGYKMDEKDFVWTSSNTEIATVQNGVVAGLGFGKVTITATSKTFDDLVVTLTFNAVPSFEYFVRKLFGHFLLFALLAFFAKIVYFRLAKVIGAKNAKVAQVILTLLAGLLTASISEVLQLDVFVGTRNFAFKDILINVLGYLFGFLVTIGITSLVKKRKNKQV